MNSVAHFWLAVPIMRQRTEEKQKEQWRFLEAQVRNRWAWTGLCLLPIGTSLDSILKKRSQWPHLLQTPLSLGPLWHSVWENILVLVCMSFFLMLFWVRVYSYRREQLAAEQEALRKAATQANGVWPPPPVS